MSPACLDHDFFSRTTNPTQPDRHLVGVGWVGFQFIHGLGWVGLGCILIKSTLLGQGKKSTQPNPCLPLQNTDGSKSVVCKNGPDIQGDPKEWVLDSGCTFHMCLIKNWFIELVDLSGGQVQMGNDMSCQIRGTGKLNLLLSNNYILELDKVRYVPELKRNLISLGELDEKYDIRIHKSLIRLILNNKEVI
ncbi:uncharacterized protein LOC111370921 [Olea europaea var. sylvestris]|uniref:uncharacterized protein LOC111370921 n=1 Tax=Olea europaea var. sylvestris TaxID=158386 RepID=UPI000C1D0071|nr:uncharacterized protein LOC111370921 [Olea europaea var. sylvestris]